MGTSLSISTVCRVFLALALAGLFAFVPRAFAIEILHFESVDKGNDNF